MIHSRLRSDPRGHERYLGREGVHRPSRSPTDSGRRCRLTTAWGNNPNLLGLFDERVSRNWWAVVANLNSRSGGTIVCATVRPRGEPWVESVHPWRHQPVTSLPR